jgi:hypothetical protein
MPMQAAALPELDPASLPVDAHVGLWRVKGWAGRGSYGAVYRAVRADCEEAGWVALKFAVRCGDGRVFLTDFGSANYVGASRLTPQAWPPGTPAYRSPEASRFIERVGPEATVRYAATPADDLFALGVTAYRLVTDEYPASLEPPPAVLNMRVAPRLSELILQMLATRPEARGAAGALADKLEDAAEQAGPEADLPLFVWEELPSASWSTEEMPIIMGPQRRPRRRDRQVARLAGLRDAAERLELERQEIEERARTAAHTEQNPARALVSPRGLPLILLAACALVLVMIRQMGPRHFAESQAGPEKEGQPETGKSAAEKVGLGDDARPAATASSSPTSISKGIRLNVPPTPLDGQRRPPCSKGEVEIQGGCWGKLEARPPNCLERSYEWKGGCYMPIMLPPPPANSDQP